MSATPVASHSVITLAGSGQVQPLDEGFDKAHRVLSADVVVQGFRQKQELGTVMTGDMWHIAILAQHVPRRNPLRESFHTVCKNYASSTLRRRSRSPMSGLAGQSAGRDAVNTIACIGTMQGECPNSCCMADDSASWMRDGSPPVWWRISSRRGDPNTIPRANVTMFGTV
jgi:hypothetical protein